MQSFTNTSTDLPTFRRNRNRFSRIQEQDKKPKHVSRGLRITRKNLSIAQNIVKESAVREALRVKEATVREALRASKIPYRRCLSRPRPRQVHFPAPKRRNRKRRSGKHLKDLGDLVTSNFPISEFQRHRKIFSCRWSNKSKRGVTQHNGRSCRAKDKNRGGSRRRDLNRREGRYDKIQNHFRF